MLHFLINNELNGVSLLQSEAAVGCNTIDTHANNYLNCKHYILQSERRTNDVEEQEEEEYVINIALKWLWLTLELIQYESDRHTYISLLNFV